MGSSPSVLSNRRGAGYYTWPEETPNILPGMGRGPRCRRTRLLRDDVAEAEF
jgi:hypothetical protein